MGGALCCAIGKSYIRQKCPDPSVFTLALLKGCPRRMWPHSYIQEYGDYHSLTGPSPSKAE